MRATPLGDDEGAADDSGSGGGASGAGAGGLLAVPGGERERAWVAAAEEELSLWIDELLLRQAEVERRVQGAETARLSAQADALATRRREGARAERAEAHGRSLASSLHVATRNEQDAAEELETLKAAGGAGGAFAAAAAGTTMGSAFAAGGARAEATRWARRAHAAEAHNGRVAALLGKYVHRNQLAVPSMPASILGAQQLSELQLAASSAVSAPQA